MSNLAKELLQHSHKPKQMLTFGRYCKATFGEKVRKIPIAMAGFTCPNIDGTVAKGGCIFCKNESFSPILDKQPKFRIKMNPTLSENPLLNTQLAQLDEQFKIQSSFHRNKFGIKKFLIYFQSFTNTYAPLSTLKVLYRAALSLPNVVGMSIGTRTDSVSLELLDFLVELKKEFGVEIWVEYGIQSIFNQTLQLINRGHTANDFPYWIQETTKRGLKECSHIIFGLPNENREMMFQTLDKCLQWGSQGIKIHPLYVIKQTILAKMYERGEYKPIELEEYVSLIVSALQRIPNNVVIHRVSAGVRDESLIAPLWCFDKNIQMRSIREALKKVNIEY